MARRIHSRLKITGALITATPLHVGGFGESADTDLPLASNGKGEWYVPGTSIAGVLRSWCEKNFGKGLTATLFGPRHFRGNADGHASFVLIEDATIEEADKVIMEIRDGVGIDRFYGTAANQAKFDRAILPRGTKLNFRMTAEFGEEGNANHAKAVIGNLLSALADSKVRFGAARTRGLGRVKLEDCKIREENFSGFAAMIKILKGENSDQSFDVWNLGFQKSLNTIETKEIANLQSPPPRLDIIIHWKPRLPLMVKAGYDGIGVDMLPLTSGVGKDEKEKNYRVALCLPGSSIKGTMRSQGERIIRTVLDLEEGDRVKTRGKDFHEQIDNLPIIEDLFGAKNNQTNTKGLGALAIDDCYAREIHSENGKQESYWMDAKQWGKVEVAIDAKKENGQGKSEEASYYQRELWRRLREIDKAMGTLNNDQYKEGTERFRIDHHVAIDRWTGGASEGALYSILVPKKVEWEEMRLSLDFNRLKSVELPALMLLLLILRDLAENRLPFGFATNRGLGEIVIKSIEFSGSGRIKVKKVAEQDGKIIEESKELEFDLANAISAVVENSKCQFTFSDANLQTQMQMRWKK